MFNSQCEDSNISKSLQLLLSLGKYTMYSILVSLLASIDLRSQSQCILSTYPFFNFEISRLVKCGIGFS